MDAAYLKNNNLEQLNFHENKVHIWHIPLKEKTLSCPSGHSLSEMELERANRIRIPEARDQYVQTRVAIRKILGIYLAHPPEQIQFGYTDYHKPFIRDNPQNIEFNISHSANYALCVISNNRSVGIDLEKIKPLDDLDQLVRGIFSAEELSDYSKKISQEKLDYFYRAWSRKEAFIKAQGKGFFHPVTELDLARFPPEGQLTLMLPDIYGEQSQWTFHDFSLTYENDKYQACVCWQGCKASIAKFDLKDGSKKV